MGEIKCVLKEILEALEIENMRVHEIMDRTILLVPVTLFDTHYVMRGADIVHVGNLITIQRFAFKLGNNK